MQWQFCKYFKNQNQPSATSLLAAGATQLPLPIILLCFLAR